MIRDSWVGSGSPLVRPFYPSLDGLRAVAFALVFLHHYGAPLWLGSLPVEWGWVGVDLFFVLSGFLITGILYDSLHRQDFFRNFYARRALRIFPAPLAIWTALLLLTPLLHVEWDRYFVADVFYVGNFFMPFHGINLPFLVPHTASTPSLQLGHFWSLAVEEQFYLVWPLVVWLVRTRTTLMKICLGYGTGAIVLRGVLLHMVQTDAGRSWIYADTFTRSDTLLVGAWLALWLRGERAQKASGPSLRWGLVASAALVMAVIVPFSGGHGVTSVAPAVELLGFTAIAWGMAGVVLFALNDATLLARAMRWRPLRKVGQISYGLYLYHYLFLGMLTNRLPMLERHHVAFLFPVMALGTTTAIAMLSYRFVESPFLRLKDRWAPRPGASDPPPFAAGALPAVIVVSRL